MSIEPLHRTIPYTSHVPGKDWIQPAGPGPHHGVRSQWDKVCVSHSTAPIQILECFDSPYRPRVPWGLGLSIASAERRRWTGSV